MGYGIETVVDGFHPPVTAKERWPRTIARTYLEHQQLRELLRSITGQRSMAAEFGCGYGRMIPVLTEFAQGVIGLERDEELCEMAERALGFLGMIQFEQVASLSHSKLPNKSINLILTFTVLQHLTDTELQGVAAEFARVAAPDALIVCCEETDPKHRGPATWGRSPRFYEQAFGAALVKTAPRMTDFKLQCGEFMVFSYRGF